MYHISSLFTNLQKNDMYLLCFEGFAHNIFLAMYKNKYTIKTQKFVIDYFNFIYRNTTGFGKTLPSIKKIKKLNELLLYYYTCINATI